MPRESTFDQTGQVPISTGLHHRQDVVSFPMLLPVTCPACCQVFDVAEPPLAEVPCEVDYDCEICCHPMIIFFDESEGEVWAEARSLAD